MKPGSATCCAIAMLAAAALAAEPAVDEIEREIAASARETAARQARLKDRVSLAEYAALVRTAGGTNIWTAALQKALDEHEIVVVPARREP